MRSDGPVKQLVRAVVRSWAAASRGPLVLPAAFDLGRWDQPVIQSAGNPYLVVKAFEPVVR